MTLRSLQKCDLPSVTAGENVKPLNLTERDLLLVNQHAPADVRAFLERMTQPGKEE